MSGKLNGLIADIEKNPSKYETLPGNLAPYKDSNTGKVDLEKAAADVKAGKADTGNVIENKKYGYSGGGGGGYNSSSASVQSVVPVESKVVEAPVSKGYGVESVGGKRIEAYEPNSNVYGVESFTSDKQMYEAIKQNIKEKNVSLVVGGGGLNLFGKSLYQPGLVQQGVKAGGQVVSKGGAFVFQNLIPQVGKVAASPVGKVAVEVGKGVVVTTVGVSAAKGGYDVLNPTTELTEEEKKEFVKEAEKRTEQRIASEGLDIPFVDSTIEKGFTANVIGGTAYAFPGGRLAMIPTFTEEYKGVLAERKSNLSEEQRNKIAEKQLGKELYVGSVAELATLGYSSQKIGEGIGRPTAQLVGNFLGAGTKTMSKSVATGVAGVSGLIGGVFGGAAEGAVVYPAQQISRSKEIKGEDWLGTTLFSGAFAGGGGALIGAGSVAFPTLTKVVYNAAGALELGGEQYGDYKINKVAGNAFDLMLNVGEKGTEVKTGLIIPGSVSNAVAVGTLSSTVNNSASQGFVAGTLNPNRDVSVGILNVTPLEGGRSTVGINTKEEGFVPSPSKSENVISNLVVEPNPDVPSNSKSETNIRTQTFSYVSTLTPTQTYVPTYAGRHIPFIPPIRGGGDFGGKSSKRERTRFIDEFSAAFAGLSRPNQPTYFGKEKPINLARKMYKPKKKSKRPGGFNYAAIFA